MRFQIFDRKLGVAGTAPDLGTDATPNGASDPNVLPISSLDNLLAINTHGPSGQPVRNILVGSKYVGAGPYVAVTATLWFYEQSSNRWYKMEAAKSLTQDQLTRFLAPSPLAPSAMPGSSGVQQASIGGIQAYLEVSAVGAANGTYTFAMAADSAG